MEVGELIHMDVSRRSTWDEQYLNSFDLPRPRELAEEVSHILPGIDARSAHIMGLLPDRERVVSLVRRALDLELFSMRFVEAIAKGPNINWYTLLGVWEGVLGPESQKSILSAVENSLGEARYAEELEAQGAVTDLQYFTGRYFIDIRVATKDQLELNCAFIDQNSGDVVPSTLVIEPDTMIAIEFKSYSTATSFLRNTRELRREIHVGRETLGRVGVATVKNFWGFTARHKVSTYRMISKEGAYLLVSGVSKQALREHSIRILEEGRKLCDR